MGENIFKNSSEHFAHYVFNKGFGIMSDTGTVVYDYVAQKTVLSEGKTDQKLENLGKAMTQEAFQDFLERK